MGLPSSLASSASMSNKSTPVWAWQRLSGGTSTFVPTRPLCLCTCGSGRTWRALVGGQHSACSSEYRRCTACVRIGVIILVSKHTRKDRRAYTCLCPKRQSCSGPVGRSWGRTDHNDLLVAARPRPSSFKCRRLSDEGPDLRATSFTSSA